MINTIISIIVIVLIILSFLPKNEKFTAIMPSPNAQLAVDINNFLRSDTDFDTYLNFLKNKNNTSYNLIKPNIFYELRFMKTQNTLTPKKIEAYIK